MHVKEIFFRLCVAMVIVYSFYYGTVTIRKPRDGVWSGTKSPGLSTNRPSLVKVNTTNNSLDVLVPYGRLISAATSPVPTQGNPNVTSNYTAVVIVTYMRSGSSLTGDILQQHPDSFYMYEPLRNLQKMEASHSSLKYLDGRTLHYPFDFLTVGTELIEGWLTCNFTKIYTDALRDTFLDIGRKTRQMRKCLKSHGLQYCIAELRDVCLRSKFRIVKTIRVPMPFLGQLFEKIPTFKIVHLVRDPRATLFSQNKRGKCSVSFGGKRGCTNILCTRVEYDITFEKTVRANYPDRLKTIKYELIAAKPEQAAHSLYQFVGMEFLDSIRKYIYDITSAGHKDACVICTTRANSSEHIDLWKTGMESSFIDGIQYRCNFVMKTYNYVRYDKKKHL